MINRACGEQHTYSKFSIWYNLNVEKYLVNPKIWCNQILTFAFIFTELIITFATYRLPRPHKNYNFADPLKPRSLAYYVSYHHWGEMWYGFFSTEWQSHECGKIISLWVTKGTFQSHFFPMIGLAGVVKTNGRMFFFTTSAKPGVGKICDLEFEIKPQKTVLLCSDIP